MDWVKLLKADISSKRTLLDQCYVAEKASFIWGFFILQTDLQVFRFINVIYISTETSYLYPNLYDQGESLTVSQSYVLEFVGVETTQTITDTQEPNIKEERFFQFDLPDLSSTKDGYYTFNVKKDGTVIYTELAYITIKTLNTYNSNTISNTYVANGTA